MRKSDNLRVSVPVLSSRAVLALVLGAALGFWLGPSGSPEPPAKRLRRSGNRILESASAAVSVVPEAEPAKDADRPMNSSLKRYRDLILRRRAAEKAGEDLQDAVASAWNGLHAEAFADPETFLSILRLPENEDLSAELLKILYPESSIEGTGRDAIVLADLPKLLADGLLRLLRQGTRKQKVSVLNALHGDSLVPLGSGLLSDADPEVESAVLHRLAWSMEGLGPPGQSVGLLRDAWGRHSAAEVRIEWLNVVSRLDRAEARALFLEKVEEVVGTPDEKLRASVREALSQSMGQGVRPEDEPRYESILAAAIRREPEPYQVVDYLNLALELPLPRVQRLLDQARACVTEPEVLGRIERTLSRIRAGETRSEVLTDSLAK